MLLSFSRDGGLCDFPTKYRILSVKANIWEKVRVLLQSAKFCRKRTRYCCSNKEISYELSRIDELGTKIGYHISERIQTDRLARSPAEI